MRRHLYTLLLLSFISLTAFGQVYDNAVYRNNITSIEFYNSVKQGSLPIIDLNAGEKLVLGFDDLSGRTSNFYYTLEHCDAKWNSSRLQQAEYMQSFTEDRILDYRYSANTYRKYVHYEVKFPNSNIIPKYAGNYILKVYEDGDQSNLLFTRRMYVLNTRVGITANLVQSNDPAKRQTNQKLNFTIDYGNLRVQNPGVDMRAIVMQNFRSEIGMMNTRPTYIRGTQLIYNDVNINDFPGRNEFRLFDMRTLKAGARNIERIYRDTSTAVILVEDVNRSDNYSFQYDNNGNFFILNQDGTDPRIDADYAHVYFTLNARKTASQGSVYVVGRFNNYKLEDANKLQYDTTTGKFFTNLFFKQGVYDYEYMWVDAATKKADDIPIEGTFFETENDYQVFVYYRPPGARWEELAGFQQVNTGKK
ncbi:MAG: DUF5103 domain-containing protein [Sphingobacteriaceae bacterium]|nr:MAG: DUF5103 domain-containing protein [Sphingobacteriaceae bacterium]